ncbi:MAG: type II toxin-antitoxin system PemK/MazF family toxin [Clostridium butyricum]|nr:MAG TPA: PemK-like protein [Caudoviricetes sp.]
MDLKKMRGQIYRANLGNRPMGGIRPVVVIQNDVGNTYSSMTIVIPITNSLDKAKLPTHVEIEKIDGLNNKSIILTELITSIKKDNLIEKIGELSEVETKKVEKALQISVGRLVKKTSMDNQKNSVSDEKENESTPDIDIEKYQLELHNLYELVKEHDLEFKKSNSSPSKWKEWIIGGIVGAIISLLLTLVIQE